MKTLFVSYRVSNLDRSLAFYLALGYEELGRVEADSDARLVMLRFPGEQFVSLELVYRPGSGRVDVGTGIDHLAIQVDDLAITLERLTAAGLKPGPVEFPGGVDGPKTSWITDPDEYPIELVEWPPGHADGLSDADFS